MKRSALQKSILGGKVLAGLRQNQPSSIGFRMMPMIDVLFLLLIFFILTAHFRPKESSLPMNLPSGPETGAVSLIDPLPISIKSGQSGCTVQIGSAKAIAIHETSMQSDVSGVVGQLGKILESQKRTQKDPLELVCDNQVQWRYVARLYNELYGLGIQNITFRITE